MVVVNLAEQVGASFYNGGWIKSVTGLDKTQANGYSLMGEFVNKGLVPLEPGLYLVNDVGGSRKNQTNNYTLVKLTADGSVETLAEETGTSGYNRDSSKGRDWAVRLWPAVEAGLASFSGKAILEQEKAALQGRLSEINALLAEAA